MVNEAEKAALTAAWENYAKDKGWPKSIAFADGFAAGVGHRDEQPAAGVNQQLFSALQLFIDTVEEPPEANCSCHIAPPCGDCINYSQLREAFEEGRAAIAAAEAAKGGE